MVISIKEFLIVTAFIFAGPIFGVLVCYWDMKKSPNEGTNFIPEVSGRCRCRCK